MAEAFRRGLSQKLWRPTGDAKSKGCLRRRWSVWHLCLSWLIAFGLVGSVAQAQQQPIWSVLPFAAEGLDPNLALTFHSVFSTELSNATQARLLPAPYPCQDASCAHAAAARLGAHFVVFGSLRPLGTKIVATASTVEGATGRVMASQSMSVDRVEDLDVVAKRLADSLVTGTPVHDNAQLGTVTRQEAAPEVRRGVASSVSLRMGGIVPLSNSGYAGLGTGMVFDLGMWLEATHFAVEPRVGIRFDAYREERGAYLEVPFDLGAYFIMSQGDFAPIIGGGAGLHYLAETRRHNMTVGQTLVSEHVSRVHDGGWGLGAHGRVGLLMFRTYKARVLIMGDYNATFVELNGGKVPQSFVFGLSVIL